MKSIFKKLIAAAVTAALACTALFAGCTVAFGTDGRDGQDVSIYAIWDAIKQETNRPDLTFDDFIHEYLNYDGQELEQMTSLQAAINRSLLSSVQVTASFTVVDYSGRFPQTETSTSQGSGVIIDVGYDESGNRTGDMYVVTNCHVVFNNNSVDDSKFSSDVDVYIYGKPYSIYTYDYTNYYIDDTNAISATVIGASLTYDLAVLKIEGSDIVRNSSVIAAEWSSGEDVSVGQTVYAIGNAAGSGISATNGIICVDSEEISLDMYETTSDYSDDFTYRTIRTSVPIYSGNSGGGLFNTDGQLVGIINSKTTAASYGEYSDNISHALPAANARRVVQSMIDYYNSTNSFVSGVNTVDTGIEVEAASSSARMNNTTNMVEIYETVQVTSVSTQSPAYNSIQRGDFITAIKIAGSDGTCKENVEVTRAYNFSEVLLSARAGDVISITVTRSGEESPITYSFTVDSSNISSVL